MAEIVLGLGVSHTPLLTLDWSEWRNRADADINNKALNLSDGRFVTYQQLVSERGEPYSPILTPEQFQSQADACQAQLDQLAALLVATAPDVIIIVGDDHGEFFPQSSVPAVSVFHGHTIHMLNQYGGDDKPKWVRQMGEGYAMDRELSFPAAPELAEELIQGLIDADVDVTAVGQTVPSDITGFGHAFGFIIKRLLNERAIPVLPVMLNTYYRPGVVSSARAYDIGVKLAAALRSASSGARVAIIASGGLSHFVVDEELDRRILTGMSDGNEELLRSIPAAALNSGSSEILNWILVAGAMRDLPLTHSWLEPIYRTAAGTGVGVAFASWGAENATEVRHDAA